MLRPSIISVDMSVPARLSAPQVLYHCGAGQNRNVLAFETHSAVSPPWSAAGRPVISAGMFQSTFYYKTRTGLLSCIAARVMQYVSSGVDGITAFSPGTWANHGAKLASSADRRSARHRQMYTTIGMLTRPPSCNAILLPVNKRVHAGCQRILKADFHHRSRPVMAALLRSIQIRFLQ